MHQTQLMEFKSKDGDKLRGILLRNNTGADIILMCGGFERSAISEKKFKVFADKLIENNISSFRFDCAGCGISDGIFFNMTVEKIASDLMSAINFLNEKIKVKNISLVCHSLSACAAGKILNKINFHKIILLAPAFNQKKLLRYWFAAQNLKNKKISTAITWSNYTDYLDEKHFLKDCLRNDKMTKFNYISSDYFIENNEKDYADYFKNSENYLHIHGDSDSKVPLESLNIKFANQVIVKGGDHDLERPDMFNQWIGKALFFVK